MCKQLITVNKGKMELEKKWRSFIVKLFSGFWFDKSLLNSTRVKEIFSG